VRELADMYGRGADEELIGRAMTGDRSPEQSMRSLSS
jgi:hypothetical protein